MLRLEFPHESHKDMYEDMVQEWWEFEQIPTSPSLLFRWDNYEEFLEYIDKTRKGETKNYTPSSLFFLIDKNMLLWAIDIRHNIDHPKLKKFSWHIWYGIRPSERRKWYATKILELWLEEAKKLWISKILIACHPDNTASEKVILKNGWLYYETIENENRIYKKYWITL